MTKTYLVVTEESEYNTVDVEIALGDYGFTVVNVIPLKENEVIFVDGVV